LVENTFRDVNIALANELARISERLDINVWEVIKLANKHPRVSVLQPGPGVGGHCIPVDPWFIVDRLPDEAKLISLARISNDQMPFYVFDQIMELLKGVPEPQVTVLGLAYKANVDDTRESPSHTIIEGLKGAGCSVHMHDPYVLPEISVEETLTGSDCLVLLVDHREYEALDPFLAGQVMRNKRLYVARHFAAQDAWEEAGFLLNSWEKASHMSWPDHILAEKPSFEEILSESAPRLGYVMQNGAPDLSRISGSQIHTLATIEGLQKRGYKVRTVAIQDDIIGWSDDLGGWSQPRFGLSQRKGFRIFESGIRRIQTEFHLPFVGLFDSIRFADACVKQLGNEIEVDLCPPIPEGS
jgi:hypothetical protein